MNVSKQPQPPSDAKMKELILYVAERCKNDPKFGATKLNKILFYADFISYAETGKSITGHTYRRLGQGPVPRQMPRIAKEMASDKLSALQERKYYGHTQKRTIPLRPAKLDRFSAAEIDTVNQVIERLKDANAKKVSDLSHTFIGWIVAGDGENIPYSTSLVYRPEPNEQLEEHARKLCRAE